MTPNEVARKLQVFNDWRRGLNDDIQIPDPKEIGKVIDEAIRLLESRKK